MSEPVSLDLNNIQNKGKEELIARLKASYTQKPQKPDPAQEQKQTQKEMAPAIRWEVENKDGKLNLKAVPVTTDVDISFVNLTKPSKAPVTASFLGIKVGEALKGKVEGFKDDYQKFFVQSKSHNILMAKFAELRTGFLGMMLSMIGVTSEDLIKLQRQASGNAIAKNKALFEENEYTGELLSIMGGSKKYIRTQSAVVGEIRAQIVGQCERMGLKGYFSKEKVLQTQLEQCNKILGKFNEEKMTLEYQMSMMNMGFSYKQEEDLNG